MFDLNQILSAALATAVDARLTEVLQQHANIVGALAERIAALESDAFAMRDSITALENNPAIGVDTTLEARVVALEQRLLTVAGVITPDMIVESMNKAEWLWEKVNAYIETGIDDRMERAIDDHCSTYDHDEYDSVYNEWGGEEASDFVKERDLGETVREHVEEALNNATFSVSI
jgi:hypothetical protein